MISPVLVLLVALHAGPLPPGPPSSCFKAGIVAVVASAVADVVTTQRALGRPDRVEGNPWMPEATLPQALAKAAGTAVVVGSADLLRRRGHPRLATSLLWGVAGGWTAAAIWNSTR